MSSYESKPAANSRRYEVTHKNGERTAVVVCPAFDAWVVLAVDLPEHGYEALAEHVVAVCATEDEAQKRARAWADANPKGVKPGGLSGLKEALGQ